MSLFKYIIKRTLILLPTLVSVIVLSFFLGHYMPGNPFFGHIKRISWVEKQKVDELTALHGVDLPVWDQFILYLRNFFTGSWGSSWQWGTYGVDVMLLVKAMLPRTLELMSLSLLIAFFLGKFLGSQAFFQKKKSRNTFVRFFLILLSSVPVLLSSTGIQWIFLKTPLREYTFGLSTDNQFPVRVTGMVLVDCLLAGDFALFIDVFLHYLLPVVVLSLPMTVIISQQVRSSVLDIMENDYIRTARGKGVPEKRVLKRHIMPNSMNTTITTIGMSFSVFFVNAALVEYVFRLPGIASFVITALIRHDFNVIVAGFTVITLIITLLNFLTDILYGILDPRLRTMY